MKDYIQNPKPNSYRGYHLIIRGASAFHRVQQAEHAVGDFEFRTIAMDFWASPGSSLKPAIEILRDDSESTGNKKQCADVIAQTDANGTAIRQKIGQEGIVAQEYAYQPNGRTGFRDGEILFFFTI